MSGGQYISKAREVDPYFPNYGQYIDSRRQSGLSTSRKDYYYDILMSFDDAGKFKLVSSILASVGDVDTGLSSEIRGLMGGTTLAPTATIPQEAWNADRLNDYLSEIDAAIAANQYERAVTLAYTCTEGFYRAFVIQKIPTTLCPTEILALSRIIRDYLRNTIADYPDEVLNLINHSSHAIDRARNRFSESHFGEEAGRWLAMYIRDIANIQIRLLLHFF